MSRLHPSVRIACVLALAATAIPARAELVEEIIAWVNGSIITKSEYDEEQQDQLRQLSQEFSGAELQQKAQESHEQLLLSMIDRKVLVHKAKALGIDLDKAGRELLDGFKQEQGIGSDLELDRMLVRDGLTRKQATDKLIEIQIPREVIRSEVLNRVAVSDAEILAYYEQHTADFFVEGQVTFREIVLLADTDERKRQRRSEGQEILRRIRGGESFAALAGTLSEAGTKAVEGRLGPLKKTDLSDILVGVLFTLPIGQVSEVVETPYGFHIVVVESREEDHTRPIHEVREKLRLKLQGDKRDAELRVFMDRARAESKWCVKPKHQDLLPIPSPPCETL